MVRSEKFLAASVLTGITLAVVASAAVQFVAQARAAPGTTRVDIAANGSAVPSPRSKRSISIQQSLPPRRAPRRAISLSGRLCGCDLAERRSFVPLEGRRLARAVRSHHHHRIPDRPERHGSSSRSGRSCRARSAANSSSGKFPVMRAASTPYLGSQFDDFLFAPIGEEENGMVLSVVSALARLNLDPWQEAAKLTGLPVGTATQRLASLIAALPDAPPARLSPGAIATSLIALLPRQTSFQHGAAGDADRRGRGDQSVGRRHIRGRHCPHAGHPVNYPGKPPASGAS